MSERPAGRSTQTESITPLAPRALRRVLFRQTWHDVVFLHWEADPREVAALLPAGTRPDLFHGRTYVGLVFFALRNLAVGRTPPLPHLGSFTEVNVRLYSRDALGRRGVVFRSLDCDRLLPVLAARAGLGLPYRWAHASRRRSGSRLFYGTRRRGADGPGGHVRIDVGGEAVSPRPLDEFLTYRWGLHESLMGRTFFMPNAHPAWAFRECALLGWDASVVTAAGLTEPVDEPVSTLYAPGVPVRFGPPGRLPAP